MNPLDAMVARLGSYIAQLEQELGRAQAALTEAAKRIEELEAKAKK